MNFKEDFVESRRFYRVFNLFQNIDDSKRYKRDLFNVDKAREKESQLAKIRCPQIGRKQSDQSRDHPMSSQQADKLASQKDEKKQLISQEDRKGAEENGERTGPGRQVQSNQKFVNKVLIESQESIFEDTISELLTDVIAEIARETNFSQETNRMFETVTETLCMKELRDEL